MKVLYAKISALIIISCFLFFDTGSAQNRSISSPKPGEVWTETVTGMAFVWVPGGCFQMGSNGGESDEQPVHSVCLDGFWMGQFEVTNQEYRKFKPSHSSRDYDGVDLNADDQPVVYVSWNDAQDFIVWLNRRSGQQFDLPTEAQWEYAARGGTPTVRFWGDDSAYTCNYANIFDLTGKAKFNFGWPHHNCTDGYAGAAPVGQFTFNPFGLYDLLGNVFEWCRDVYLKDGYARHGKQNPVVTSGGSSHVLRGGSWYTKPSDLRVSYRVFHKPDQQNNSLGFRLVKKP